VEDLIEILGDGTAVIRLHVQPGATRTAVTGVHGNALKVAVTAPPDAGRANTAVLALVAGMLGVRRSSVRLLTGTTSRLKRVAIDGMAPDAVREAVGNALAASGVARRQP
jgi:hypothetical protein